MNRSAVICVVIFSALVFPGRVNPGVAELLPKPPEPAQLRRVLSRWLREEEVPRA